MSVIITAGDRTIIRKKAKSFFRLYKGYAIKKEELEKINTPEIVLIIENEDKTEEAFYTTPTEWKKGIPYNFNGELQVIMPLANMRRPV